MSRTTEITQPLTGLFLLTGIAIMVFGLFTDNVNMLFFAIPIIFALIVSVSRGFSDIDNAVASIGVSGYNIRDSITLGLTAGVMVYVIGSMLITFTDDNTMALVPMFAISNTATASVIPSYIFLGINILIQWLVVAPSEEVGFRFLSPYVINSLVNNLPISMIVGTLLWVFIHIPTYTIQNAPLMMYLVLVIMGIVAIYLIWITGSLISAIILHAVFNTIVVLISGPPTWFTYIVLITISISLLMFYTYGGENHNKKQTPFNL